jgi:ribonucleoside-diphosphate reductase alpha chain
MGHIKMMAATQPFLSGAISKTVNLPQDCSVDDIAEAYMEAWRQGIKAVAIYRDNSKGTQPLNVTAQTDADKKGTKAADTPAAAPAVAVAPQPATDNPQPAPPDPTVLLEVAQNLESAYRKLDILQTANAALTREINQLLNASTQNSDSIDAQAPPRAVRHRLPAERASVTHKFALSGHEGYITVGLYPNGSPGEIFIRMAKEGSTVSGLMDSFATAISISLQHGVPLRVLCEKFAHTRFEPSGWTGNPEIGYAKSIMDYIFRWIQIRFLSGTQLDLFAGLQPPASVPVEGAVTAPDNTVSLAAEPDAPSLSFRTLSEVERGEESASSSSAPVILSEAHRAESKDPDASRPAQTASYRSPSDAPASAAPESSASPRAQHLTVPSALASLSAAVDASPQAVLQREQRETRSISDQNIFDNGARNRFDNARRQYEHDRTPPQHGIAPEPSAKTSPASLANDLAARSGLTTDAAVGKSAFRPSSLEDRGIYSPAEAMRDMVDMGDAPSCATCGAIMTRSGSCYRCMSCGSTSGCS